MTKQVAAYKKLAKAIDDAPTDPNVTAALEAFEPLFFNNMVKYVPEQSVSKLDIGDPIRFSRAQFERLAKAFFTEIELKFL